MLTSSSHHILTSSIAHIFISSHPHIFISSHPHIFTSSQSHLFYLHLIHSHLLSLRHLHIFFSLCFMLYDLHSYISYYTSLRSRAMRRLVSFGYYLFYYCHRLVHVQRFLARTRCDLGHIDCSEPFHCAVAMILFFSYCFALGLVPKVRAMIQKICLTTMPFSKPQIQNSCKLINRRWQARGTWLGSLCHKRSL